MARSDPVARERVTRDGDVDVGLGVETLPTLDARFEQAEVLELARAGGLDSGAVAERFQVEPFLGLTECSAPPPASIRAASSENERPSVPPVPAVFSRCSGQRSESASAAANS